MPSILHVLRLQDLTIQCAITISLSFLFLCLFFCHPNVLCIYQCKVNFFPSHPIPLFNKRQGLLIGTEKKVPFKWFIFKFWVFWEITYESRRTRLPVSPGLPRRRLHLSLDLETVLRVNEVCLWRISCAKLRVIRVHALLCAQRSIHSER